MNKEHQVDIFVFTYRLKPFVAYLNYTTGTYIAFDSDNRVLLRYSGLSFTKMKEIKKQLQKQMKLKHTDNKFKFLGF